MALKTKDSERIRKVNKLRLGMVPEGTRKCKGQAQGRTRTGKAEDRERTIK